MPFENQWARIPLAVRWGMSLLVGAALVVALVILVSAHTHTGLAHIRAKAARQQDQQAQILIGQDQAPHTVALPSAGSAKTALEAGVRAEMRHRIATGNVDGPLQGLACGVSGHHGAETGYHCIAKAADVNYPFLAVADPGAHRIAFCKKDFPPAPGENIPVSLSCRL